MDFEIPKVMGILNITPDSFYAHSRSQSREQIGDRVVRMIEEGADIIDIGGCSTRPGFSLPSVEEEMERIDRGCEIIREIAPEIVLSVDTFRASVARAAVEKWNVGIINDVSGGEDPEMFSTVADLRKPYILTHNRKDNKGYKDISAEVIEELSKKANELYSLGVNDVIMDPGFGFAKTLEENFRLFSDLTEISKMGKPLLVGISRKSMIYKTLGKTPEETLEATVALDAIALEKGADILRVHDVRPAVETVKLFKKLKHD